MQYLKLICLIDSFDNELMTREKKENIARAWRPLVIKLYH